MFFFLVLINALVNSQATNETHSHQNQNQHQNAFLVKTTLTKEQVETLLKQHQEKNKLENPSQVELIQLKKKGKSKKNLKKEPSPEQGATEREWPKAEVIEQSKPIDAEKISLGLFDFFFDDYDSDNNDTEDLPDPDLEKQENQTETTEVAEPVEPAEPAEPAEPVEPAESAESGETAAEKTPTENKENEKVTLLANKGSIKTANTQGGITISGFFSLIILTLAFGSFLVYVTQPRKKNKNYYNSLNRMKISF